MSEFRKITQWAPAYNRTAEGYGRGSMDVRFVLVGEKGAVQFLLCTGFDHSSDRAAGCRPLYPYHALPGDLGYHSRTPQYEDQQPTPKPCEYLDGATCYYAGSGLNAEDAFDVFTDGGEDALWEFLGRYYAATFDGAEFPPEIGRRFQQAMQSRAGRPA